jgi:hypothetical protein
MGQKSTNSIIRKILFAHQDKKQLFFAFFGVLIGFVFISISIHYLLLIKQKSSSVEMLDSSAITIQKEVTTSNTLAYASTSFSKKEIDFYKNLPYLEKVVTVENNNFSVELKSNDPLVPYFRSDIFIQSIPSDFLDVKSTAWIWNVGNKQVPIILPRDFVYMMNNFLSSSGMPQLSDEILKDVNFQIKLGDQNPMFFDAKIIGFTNEISSILVPESFMKYGTQNYGVKTSTFCTQLMLKSKKGQFGHVEELVERNHLEVKKNQLIEGKLKSILTIILSSITFISLVVVLVSMIVLIQFLQLLITKNTYEIRTMLRLGVSIQTIVFHFIKYVFLGFLIVLSLIILIDFILFYYINEVLNSAGFNLTNTNYFFVIFILTVLFIIVFVSTIISINRFVQKEF